MVDVNSLYPIVYDLIDEEHSYSSSLDKRYCVPPSPTSVTALAAPPSLYGTASVHHYYDDDDTHCDSPLRASSMQEDSYYSSQEASGGDSSFRRVQSTNALQQEAARDAVTETSHMRRNSAGDVREPVCYCSPRKASNTFDSTFVLTRQIDTGSSSSRSVWETIHRRTGIRYAVKIVDRQSLSKEENDSIYKEVRLLKKLQCDLNVDDDEDGDGDAATHQSNKNNNNNNNNKNHNNVLQLVDFFEEPSQFYIVTEYAQTNLLDYLLDLHDENASLGEDKVKILMQSILHSVQSIHAQNICHRDLKLENILLENSSDITSVRIADFGLAAELYPPTPTATAVGDEEKTTAAAATAASGGLTDKCGSLCYLAPEILQRERPYNTQVDMWSLGVIMYSIVAGVFPFMDRSRPTLIRKIMKGDYVFVKKDWSRMSRDATKFVASLLRVDPAKRMTIQDALNNNAWINPPTTMVLEIPNQEQQQQKQQQQVHLQQPLLEKEHLEMVHFDKQEQDSSTVRRTNCSKKKKIRFRRVFLKAIGRHGRRGDGGHFMVGRGGRHHKSAYGGGGDDDGDDQTMSVASSSDLQQLLYESNNNNSNNAHNMYAPGGVGGGKHHAPSSVFSV
jgi:serine/threonine kinase 33